MNLKRVRGTAYKFLQSFIECAYIIFLLTQRSLYWGAEAPSTPLSLELTMSKMRIFENFIRYATVAFIVGFFTLSEIFGSYNPFNWVGLK